MKDKPMPPSSIDNMDYAINSMIREHLLARAEKTGQMDKLRKKIKAILKTSDMMEDKSEGEKD